MFRVNTIQALLMKCISILKRKFDVGKNFFLYTRLKEMIQAIILKTSCSKISKRKNEKCLIIGDYLQ